LPRSIANQSLATRRVGIDRIVLGRGVYACIGRAFVRIVFNIVFVVRELGPALSIAHHQATIARQLRGDRRIFG
jgi:hypothetical protein